MFDVEIYTTPCELGSFELCTIVYDDPSENAESKDYNLHELNCCLMCDVYYYHCLHPLTEHVNGDKEKNVPFRCPG
jgi:hypothetical protein